MIYYQDPVTTLWKGDIRQVVKELPPVDMIMTSPPYYSMRKYSGDDLIWDAKEGCQHEWEEVITERVDETGFERNRRGLNRAAEMIDGNPRTGFHAVFLSCSFLPETSIS